MKKRKINHMIVAFLSALMAAIVCTIMFCPIRNKSVYYFPEIETFIEVVKPYGEYGYIYFGESGSFISSQECDYVRISSMDAMSVSIICNPSDKRKLYVYDRWNPMEVCCTNYDISIIQASDSVFFMQETVHRQRFPVLKSDYFEIIVDNNFDSVYFVDHRLGTNPVKAVIEPY